VWFLSRFAKAGLGIVPFGRTHFHRSPYTFKQTIVFRRLSSGCLTDRKNGEAPSPQAPKPTGTAVLELSHFAPKRLGGV
ncbi:MAG: hypothetical protein ABSH49_12735, partial [Bryobacteraceae bacterium]